jgi:hypothetical protein
MTSGRKIRIDADEVEKVAKAISTGGFFPARQGIIVGSMVVDIVLDEERQNEFLRLTNQVKKHNDFQKKYHDGKDLRKMPELQPLQNIFKEIPRLNSGNN